MADRREVMITNGDWGTSKNEKVLGAKDETSGTGRAKSYVILRT